MDIDDEFIVLLISESVNILGFITKGKLTIRKSLNIEEERNVLDKLIIAYNHGYEHCVVTRDSVLVLDQVQ